MFLVSCLTSLGTGPFIREKQGCGNRYPRLLSIGSPINPHEWEGFEQGREVTVTADSQSQGTEPKRLPWPRA